LIDKSQFLIDTDLLLEHLTHQNLTAPSILEKAMTKGICFTTVINASELFFAASDDVQRESIQDLLSAIKVLGLNSRYSLKISKFFNKVATTRDALLCTVAEFNRLPILTNDTARYSSSGIKIINPLEM
jgi:predicted nucleic acid-binding protein